MAISACASCGGGDYAVEMAQQIAEMARSADASAPLASAIARSPEQAPEQIDIAQLEEIGSRIDITV